MKKLLAFIFWPALAGLVFAFTLLQAPRLVEVMPGLAAYFPEHVAPIVAVTSFNEAIRRSAPSVVSINYKETMDGLRGLLTPEGFTPLEKIQDDSNSLGSGVIIREDGYIITSNHVVTANENISGNDINITLQDGRVIPARVISQDEDADLALLKVDIEQLPALRLADTSRLQVGDVVLAIGNPRNVGQSVTFGIISAMYSRDDSFVIQTDAAINPGNSGGALINIDGDLIGINSTIVSESGGSEGIGFSIPANRAIALLDQFLASRPGAYLGVSGNAFTLAEGRQHFSQDVQGIEVDEVKAYSPAEKAGIQVGDIITGVGDKKLQILDPEDEAEAMTLVSSISGLSPGDEIVLEVFRGDKFLQVPAILGVGVRVPQIFNTIEELEPGQATQEVFPSRIN